MVRPVSPAESSDEGILYQVIVPIEFQSLVGIGGGAVDDVVVLPVSTDHVRILLEALVILLGVVESNAAQAAAVSHRQKRCSVLVTFAGLNRASLKKTLPQLAATFATDHVTSATVASQFDALAQV